MGNNELEVKIKIGEIEFYAKGQTDDVEAQRQNFTNIILPTAVDAIKNSRLSQSYIMETVTPTLGVISESTVDNNGELSKMSVNEFLNSKGFKTQIDVAMSLIYYNEMVKGCTDFSSDELKQYFKDARISLPKNPSDVINKLVNKSFIMNKDDKKRFCLTQSGIRFVEGFIPKEVKIKKTASVKPKRKKVKKESDYLRLSADDFNLSKYPELNLFNDFKDQMMVILYILKEEKLGDEFSTYDVQVILTDILGFSATEDQINGVFKRNPKWFKKTPYSNNQKGVKRKLLNYGIEYAKGVIASKANGVE